MSIDAGYSGIIETKFTLTDNKDDVKLDFQGKQISDIQVNGYDVSEQGVTFEKHQVVFPAKLFKKLGENTICLHFRNTYVTNGAGLHYYKDPKDNKVYIFSHLEPFFCNRFFPCFDQPSIRAPLKLQVLSPDAKWQVISNGMQT
jgi:aminopeptidase N